MLPVIVCTIAKAVVGNLLWRAVATMINNKTSGSIRLGFDDHFQSASSGCLAKSLISILNLVQLEPMRNQDLWIDLPGLDGLKQHRCGNSVH